MPTQRIARPGHGELMLLGPNWQLKSLTVVGMSDSELAIAKWMPTKALALRDSISLNESLRDRFVPVHFLTVTRNQIYSGLGVVVLVPYVCLNLSQRRISCMLAVCA